MVKKKTGRIATVSGRYYAMDRDKRWDRVQKAYDAITSGAGEFASSALQAVRNAYERDENDEFVLPTVIAYGAEELLRCGMPGKLRRRLPGSPHLLYGTGRRFRSHVQFPSGPCQRNHPGLC